MSKYCTLVGTASPSQDKPHDEDDDDDDDDDYDDDYSCVCEFVHLSACLSVCFCAQRGKQLELSTPK